ncbi:MAG: hypothetical protein LUQ50_02395 [Methanospirillum sp.]|uniref:hypothetical protein n=1 Tax=Methanospirillum sp. TaxID=45200 RepID=UPI002374D152|nr:hypothetical protein [Methanospirillum sp.]MDD1727904.1 hypothetical protein [Methanospirillum sp.]
MTPHRKFLLAILVLMVLFIVPAMAEVNITTLPDGSTKFSNGTYWITWDYTGPHVVGDQFFINATTNLSAGTTLEYSFSAATADACHFKNCNHPIWATDGLITVESGTAISPNITSILINSTGFKSDNYYFSFMMISSNVSTEYNAFPGPGYGIVDISSLSPSMQNITQLTQSQTSIASPLTTDNTRMRSPLPITLTLVALLGCIGIVLMMKKQEQFP